MSNIYTEKLLAPAAAMEMAGRADWTNVDTKMEAIVNDLIMRSAAFPRFLRIDAAAVAAADTDGLVTAVVSDAVNAEVIELNVNFPWPRNITATAAAVPSTGTVQDIKAIRVKVEGLNIDGEAIVEDLPAFTVNAAGTVQGLLAFKKVTKITIPIHDGTGAQTEVGFGNKLGLPDMLEANTVFAAYLNNVKEANAPTVVVDDNEVEKNTVLLNSNLNGTEVGILYFVLPTTEWLQWLRGY